MSAGVGGWGSRVGGRGPGNRGGGRGGVGSGNSEFNCCSKSRNPISLFDAMCPSDSFSMFSFTLD